MSAQHTPGPWVTGRAINVVDMGKYSFICPFGATSKKDVNEITANARLIAAAPDLLAALESLRDATKHYFRDFTHLHPSIGDPLAVADAAIARARGQS